MTDISTLNLQTIDYPFETLVARAKASPPKLILNPDFQRKYKWDKEGWGRASKFIESCLMRIPLPSCYFAENNNNAHMVIDGVQRITTIMKFMSDEFALEGLTSFPSLEGKRYSQLGSMAAELETTTIRCIILRKDNPKSLIAEIFSRLNQGAVSLSDQEIRHALFEGDFDKLLQKLSKTREIQNFKTPKDGSAPHESREGEELVLRFFAFLKDSDNYDGKLTSFLDRYMETAAREYGEVELADLETSFKNSIEACRAIFEADEVFTNIGSDRRRQGVVYFDLLMASLGKIPLGILQQNRQEIRDAYSALCISEDFKKLTAGGIQREYAVSKRNELWNEKLREAIS